MKAVVCRLGDIHPGLICVDGATFVEIEVPDCSREKLIEWIRRRD